MPHDSPLRVALITNYPNVPGRVAGGVQAVSTRLVAALRAAPDLELHVVHCHSDITESRVMHDGPVTLHFLAQSRRRIIPNMVTGTVRIAAELRRIAPDVVNAHGPSLAMAALQAGYRPIWTIHGVLAQESRFHSGLFQRLNFALARWYERQALAQVETVTTVSRYVADTYRDRGRPGATWHVIDNPAPPELFTLPRRAIAGRVLMAASLIPLKDPLTLVRAAGLLRERVPGLSIHLAGMHADAAYLEVIRGEISRLNLGATVQLLGPLDTAALRQAYSQASVVALPSRQEVAPMAVIEALAAGVPVVASNAGGLPYLVDDGVTGRLVPPGEPVALAAALADLLAHPVAAAQMGDAGRSVARQRFDPQRVAERYLALYRGHGAQTLSS